MGGTSRARTTRSAVRSSSTSRANGTLSAAAIAHSVSTLGFALPDSSCASVDLPRPAAVARSWSVRPASSRSARTFEATARTNVSTDSISLDKESIPVEYSIIMEASSIMTDGILVRQSRRSEVATGIRAVAPIAVAVLVFGASFGILARDAGMGTAAPIVMSLTTFAGSAQFATASVLGSGGAVVAAILAAVLLNLRYLAIGMSVAPSLRGGPVRRLVEAQLAVDESWAVSQRDGRVNRDRWVGAGSILMCSWCRGTVAGVFGGSAIGDPADYGLDAMFPALFL